MIAPSVVAPQKLVAPATEEVFADTELSGAWVNRTLRQVSQTGVVRITPGGSGHAVII